MHISILWYKAPDWSPTLDQGNVGILNTRVAPRVSTLLINWCKTPMYPRPGPIWGRWGMTLIGALERRVGISIYCALGRLFLLGLQSLILSKSELHVHVGFCRAQYPCVYTCKLMLTTFIYIHVYQASSADWWGGGAMAHWPPPPPHLVLFPRRKVVI